MGCTDSKHHTNHPHSIIHDDQYSQLQEHQPKVAAMGRSFNQYGHPLLNLCLVNQRNNIIEHQDPQAFIIQCMDSRCGINNWLEGNWPGSAVHINTPGAVYAYKEGDTLSSEYAALAYFLSCYHIENVVIIFHTKCGAATTAFNHFKTDSKLATGIDNWVQSSIPKEIAMQCNSPNELSERLAKEVTKKSIETIVSKLNEQRQESNKINVTITILMHDIDEFNLKLC